MTGFDLLLKRLEVEMDDCARQSLASPQARDAFEYGRMSGLYGGLSRAREIVLAMKDEEDARDI